MRGLDVIRTVWLAFLCLIGLGAVVATNAGRPTPIPNVDAYLEQPTIATDSSQDTLMKADRLEIAYVSVPVAVGPVMPATPVADETSPQKRLIIPKIVSRHWHDHSARKSAAVSSDRRIKIEEPQNGKSVDRAKATVDLRPCRRPEGFAGLLRALNLAPGCDA
jgi:hypothetical protein